MKTLILLLLGSTLAMMKADDSVEKSQLARVVASDADSLRELLKENWTVSSKDNEITLTSKFEVFIIGRVSRAGNAPEFSDKTPRKQLAAETKPEKYVIHLRYEERMSREELERRRNERQKAADILNFGAESKAQSQAAGDRYAEIQVPRYRSSYDVYQKTTETPYSGIFPPQSVQKVGGAKAILAAVLEQLRTGND